MDEIKKNVYLTFDDGIQPGTAEVLNVLSKNKVKATFFLTAIHTIYYTEVSTDFVKDIFKTILDKHIAGNHSFSHAHGFYSSYYRQGLLIDNDQNRLTVLEDFERNEFFFKTFLPINQPFMKGFIRLPGRNTWILTGNVGAKENHITKVLIDGDSANAAVSLASHNYKIYGWDDEWRMDFTICSENKRLIEQKLTHSKVDFKDFRQVYPPMNLGSKINQKKERLVESWEKVAARILANPTSDLVLLLHDRAFRPNAHNLESRSLDKLIKYLKSKSIVFKGIDEYPC